MKSFVHFVAATVVAMVMSQICIANAAVFEMKMFGHHVVVLQ